MPDRMPGLPPTDRKPDRTPDRMQDRTRARTPDRGQHQRARRETARTDKHDNKQRQGGVSWSSSRATPERRPPWRESCGCAGRKWR
eukprot:2569458-Pleurochrysis_carterae.AAC.1